MHAAPAALLAADRMRIIEAGEWGAQRFSDLRAARLCDALRRSHLDELVCA